MLSKKFVHSLKLSDRRAYQIANDAGIPPTTLSKLLNGAEPVRPKDARIIAVGKVLGLSPEECFEEDATSDSEDTTKTQGEN